MLQVYEKCPCGSSKKSSTPHNETTGRVLFGNTSYDLQLEGFRAHLLHPNQCEVNPV